MIPFNSISNIKIWVKAEWKCHLFKTISCDQPRYTPNPTKIGCSSANTGLTEATTHSHTSQPTTVLLYNQLKRKRKRKRLILTWMCSSSECGMDEGDVCIPKEGAAGWKASLWHCHSNVCGKMASHTLIKAQMVESGPIFLLWPVNYIVCTCSAYLKQLKWIHYRKDTLHQFTLTIPKLWLEWLSLSEENNPCKLCRTHTGQESFQKINNRIQPHTATFSFTFRILKMWVTLHLGNTFCSVWGISVLLASFA